MTADATLTAVARKREGAAGEGDAVELEPYLTLAGVPIVAALTNAVMAAFPRVAPAARPLTSIICSFLWVGATTLAAAGEWNRAPALAVLLGLSAAYPGAAFLYTKTIERPKEQ